MEGKLIYIRHLLLLSGAFFISLTQSMAAELHFDPELISDSNVADLSQIEKQGDQLPGDYYVDIYINNKYVATKMVKFATTTERNSKPDTSNFSGLVPCLPVSFYEHNSVKTALFSNINNQQCFTLSAVIPNATTQFDFAKMRLNLSVPQVAMRNVPNGWISPEQWDEGISAFLLSWQYSGSSNRGDYGNSNDQYLNLTSGLNYGAWRLRDNSVWSDYDDDYIHTHQWKHLNTYLQRDIIPLRSELTLGDGSTNSDVFNAFSYRGVQVETDENMYPDTMRGYAPVIEGTAHSNAQVSVLQNGNVIYHTVVAPGAFAIKDLYPVSSGGDLVVTVTEANGSTHSYTVPYSSVPVLQRGGHYQYSIIAGRYRNSSHSYDDPVFAQGTLLWGGAHNVTLYGGTQLSSNYHAFAFGAGMNMGVFGAFSSDITHANSVLSDGSRHQGQSIRFIYGHSFIATGTTMQLASYRFSTQGFHTLDETALNKMTGWTSDNKKVDASGKTLTPDWINHYDLYNNKRERWQVNISQRLGDVVSLYAIGSRQTYWNNAATTKSMQFGLASTIRKISYNCSYGYSRYSGQEKADKTLYVSVSVPFDIWLPHHESSILKNTWANYSLNSDNEGHVSQMAGLNGSALEEHNLDWSVAQGYDSQEANIGDAGVMYRGTYGNMSAGYGYSNKYHQIRYGASGSVILHSDGMTFGQPLGNTSVLVAAPHAAGIPVENEPGVNTDWRGYAIVPYSSMYRANHVALDVTKLDASTDIDNSVVNIVPTRGAIVRANYQVHSGVRALISIIHDGKPLPFGTSVTSDDHTISGLVGDFGQIYLSGLAQSGDLQAKWGPHTEQQCSIHYQFAENKKPVSVVRISSQCR